MVVAIIQARTGSSRLPNKVLMDLSGKPVLIQLVERLKFSKKIEKIIIVTTVKTNDNVIEKLCYDNGIECFRGSEEDVLDRYYQAYRKFNLSEADILLRITGDCPLIDPELVDQVIQFYSEGAYDYVSNAIEPTFPDGLDTEVFNGKILAQSWEKSCLKSEREHVTAYIRNQKDKYKIGSFKGKVNLSGLRWTLDEVEDYEFIKEIYAALYRSGSFFSTAQILDYIEKYPVIVEKNKKFIRNEGYLKSVKEDNSLDWREI